MEDTMPLRKQTRTDPPPPKGRTAKGLAKARGRADKANAAGDAAETASGKGNLSRRQRRQLRASDD
jgi:hypothetical protein